MRLVCPAGSPPALQAAIDHGADAVYVGFRDQTNARAFPGLNFTEEDMRRGIAYAHARGRQVYVALNTYPGPAVLGAWESVLGPDDYDPDVTFFEYGGDSVSVVTLGDELARVFPDVFDVTTLFSCSTVNDQTRWVEQSQARADTACDQAIDIAAIQQLLHANGGSR